MMTSTVGNEGDELAQQLGKLARSLQDERDPHEVLNRVVASAIAVIPGVEEASVSIVTGKRRITSEAPSSDLPRLVDALQTETGQGPCLDAAYEHETVHVPDMSSEERWPAFAARAFAETGVGSMLSFQLYVERDNLGALNLYSMRPHAFDAESEHVGAIFATHAAVAYADVRKLGQMTDALASRDVIGQAKGVLMERHTIDAQTAFAVLVRYSQAENRKLLDVAAEIAGGTPTSGGRARP